MVKKAISGKGRRGAPPLPRQRGALRVVQVTLLALAGFLGKLAFDSYSEVSGYFGEVVVLGAVAVMLVAGALWMGVNVVRGPQPPELD
ncbi:MAG: hypothetical protein KY393_07380 [Actinobacteria bacterium]|nr:hypothetical protein [Actinomycetota bacterium]